MIGYRILEESHNTLGSKGIRECVKTILLCVPEEGKTVASDGNVQNQTARHRCSMDCYVRDNNVSGMQSTGAHRNRY